MRNVILINKYEDAKIKPHLVDVDKIVAIEVGKRTITKLHLENETWFIDTNNLEYILSHWAPGCTSLPEYKKLKENNGIL